MSAHENFEAGRLSEAITAAGQEVKATPLDVDSRGFLCELLCFAGELERADSQLDSIGRLAPESMLGVAMFRQLVRGEQARTQFYSEGRAPEFLGEPTTTIRRQLEASVALREGRLEEIADLLSAAEKERPPLSGICDEVAFNDFRDMSDLTAGFFEVLTSNGKYYWVSAESVELVEFHPPERPRDLIWRRAHMVVRDGPDGEVFIPAIYAVRDGDVEDSARLGRSTDWNQLTDGGPVEGLGLRTFLVGDTDRTIMELGEISFTGPS